VSTSWICLELEDSQDDTLVEILFVTYTGFPNGNLPDYPLLYEDMCLWAKLMMSAMKISISDVIYTLYQLVGWYSFCLIIEDKSYCADAFSFYYRRLMI